MADERKIKRANQVYRSLCDMLDSKDFKYNRHDEDLTITFTMVGDDLPMQFVMKIDVERELIRLFSPLPVTFEKDKIYEGILSTNQANFCLADGSFDFDVMAGKVSFRMTSSFADSLISKDVFQYMIDMASCTIDDYNDKMLMLSKGAMTIEEFFEFVNKL